MLWSTSYLVFNELSECLSRQTNISIISHSGYTYSIISLLRALSERGGERERARDRARNDRLTVQKKNAVCCRNGEKVPRGKRQTHTLWLSRGKKRNKKKKDE